MRLALEHGAALVPVYNHGENDLFGQLLPNPPGSSVRCAEGRGRCAAGPHVARCLPRRIQNALLRTFGYSLPLISRLLPARRPLLCVIGSPIPVPKV